MAISDFSSLMSYSILATLSRVFKSIGSMVASSRSNSSISSIPPLALASSVCKCVKSTTSRLFSPEKDEAASDASSAGAALAVLKIVEDLQHLIRTSLRHLLESHSSFTQVCEGFLTQLIFILLSVSFFVLQHKIIPTVLLFVQLIKPDAGHKRSHDVGRLLRFSAT